MTICEKKKKESKIKEGKKKRLVESKEITRRQ
jgi:hypothetical protein